MNEGIKILYEQILGKSREIKTCLCGSYGLNGYMDMQHVYLDWEKHSQSSVVSIRRDRIGVYMKDGEHMSKEYRLL